MRHKEQQIWKVQPLLQYQMIARPCFSYLNFTPPMLKIHPNNVPPDSFLRPHMDPTNTMYETQNPLIECTTKTTIQVIIISRTLLQITKTCL